MLGAGAEQQEPARRSSPSRARLCRTLRADAAVANHLRARRLCLRPAKNARKATLIATGSEVSLAVEAREALEAQGIGTAVVSLPCWELFDEQPESYRREVLGDGLRVGIEAAGASAGSAISAPMACSSAWRASALRPPRRNFTSISVLPPEPLSKP